MENYKVKVSVSGVEKGKRKEKLHLIEVGNVSKADFESARPEVVNEMERKAKRLVEEKLKSYNKSATISFHKIHDRGDYEMVNIFPEHSELILFS